MRKIVAALALSWGICGAAFGAEKVVPFATVPKAAQDVVHSKYPGAKVLKAEEETENGKTSYEIGLNDNGQKLDVVVTPTGEVLAVEKKIPTKSVPKAVTDGLQAKYPKATLSRAEEITKGDKVTYELKITTDDKKKTEVTFDSAGTFVEEEKD